MHRARVALCSSFRTQSSVVVDQWIKSHPEGDVHPSLRIGRERPGDETSLLGLFASSAPGARPIEKGDVIARIPWD